MRATGTPWPRWLKVLFCIALLLAAGLTVVGIHFAHGKRSDAALEIAKAGLQLGAITIVGVLLTQGFKDLNYARDEQRRLDDYRLTMFVAAVDAYNDVKTVRRSLRSLGVVDLGARSDRRYELAALDVEMRALNQAELSLERIEREIRARSEVFPCGWKHIKGLRSLTEALCRVLYVWESGALISASHTPLQTNALIELKMFLASRSETKGHPSSWDPHWSSFSEFEAALRDDLTPPERAR